MALLLLTTGGSAETNPASPPIATKPDTPGAAVQSQIPDQFKLNMMIRTTLIALSQANQTGNYSVLRDLGTPAFQKINSDARLAEIFARLRQRKIDFSPILFFDPKVVRPPALQDDGLLRLTGFFETRPERILFDMGFEKIEDQWRLSAIVVDLQTQPEPAKDKQTAPPQANATKDDKSDAKAKSEPKAKAKEKAKADKPPAAAP